MDWIGITWDWLFALPAEAWAATAAWVTAGIALGTVVVAGTYAKKQVAEAQRQVVEARTARLEGDQQAREALTEQARLAQQTLDHDAAQAQKNREEASQPNVVIFMEPNKAVWDVVELAVKNFGLTPAHDVRLAFDPEPQVSSTGYPDDGITNLPYPSLIPILAPGQEWRTVWDAGPDRVTTEGLDKRHHATVTYTDRSGRAFSNAAILDWATLEPLRRVEVFSVHDLTVQMKEHNGLMKRVVDNLGFFATEHQGIWVYTGDGNDESRKRAAAKAGRAERRARTLERIRSRDQASVPTPPSGDETEPRSTPGAGTSEPEPPAPQDE